MSENIIQAHQSAPPPSQSPNIDTAATIKEPTAPAPAATQNSVPSATAPINGKADAQVVDYENLDDEEYEVEYEYEDEEEEQPAYRNEEESAFEVDGDTDDPIPGQRVVELDEDDEEVEYEEEDEEVEVDEAEYDRIANKIDELLSKTSSSLKPVDSAPPPVSAPQPASAPVNAINEPFLPPVEAIKPAEEVAKPAVETTKPEVEVATSAEPVQKVQEQVEQAEEQAAPVAQVRKPSPPVERASTVEETVGLAPPGQLRHVHNQWNISDLHDEDSISEIKEGDNSDNEAEAESRSSLEVASSLASGGAPNLSAIVEEDGESDNSKNASPIPPEMMMTRPLDRFAHQSLGDAMADEDEINEIEIALEEWTDDGDNNLEELEEEDEQDEVDELMPDNLLLHANDQALHWAAAENHGQVVATLLDQNINVHLETKDGVTASQLAEIRKNHEIAEALQDIEGAELLQAAREGSIASSRASDRSASPLPAAPPSPVQVEIPETVAEQQPQQQQQPEDRSIGLPESTRPSAIERQLSEAEIEARKDEAREIVISAIDAALARDLSKLMGGLAPGESPSGLRKRTLVLGELDEDNESGHNVALLGQLQQQNADEGGDGGTGAHNMIVSLTLAAVIFILLKLIFYFNSTT